MHIDPYILAFSAVTVFATIFMGFWSAKKSKTASDFFVAGRSVSVGWNASAISGEYLSAASFMGIAGMVMSSGYDALWYPVCYACGYLFLLLFIAGPLRRFGAYTIPDFAEGRFDSPLFRKIAVCFVLFIGFFYTMPQMKGAGTTLAYIFPGLPYWAGVVLVGAVITLNVALGGMKGITLVQAFQYWAKMFAISVPIFVLMAVYGHYGEQLNATSASQRNAAANSLYVEKLKRANRCHAGMPAPKQTLQLAKESSLKPAAMNIVGLEYRHVGSLATGKPEWVFMELSELSGLGDILWVDSWTNFTVKLPPTVEPGKVVVRRRDAVIAALDAIEAAGACLLDAGTNGYLVIKQSEREEYEAAMRALGWVSGFRKPLPEKAPADSTWLSPFGPLTTKAAKASAVTSVGTNQTATPRLKAGVNVEFITVFQGPSEMGRLKGEVKEVWHQRVTKDWGTGASSAFGSETNSVYRMLDSYAQDRWCTVLRAAELPDIIVRVPTNIYPQGKFGEMIERVLATNGVVFLHEANELVKAVPAAMVETQAPATVISAGQIRPYALLYTYSLIIALVCGTAGLPHILVRFYTNPDGVAAKRTTMWVMILIGIFYVFPPVFGVMGRNLFPGLYDGIGAKGTDKIVLELPRLLNEKYAPLGSILSGITCAGAFAAFMSTFSGLLVSMTGAMAHDVYGRMLRPKSTPEQRMRMFKVFAVVIGCVAMLLGSFVEALEINFMVGQAFAIAAASYFPLLFMAVWCRKLTMKGAATGMLTGGLSAVVAISLTSFSALAAAPGRAGELFAMFKPLNEFWAHHPLLRILCEQPAIWAVPLAIGLMIVVSKLTHREVPADIRMKMLVLHAPEKLGLKQEYIQEHQPGH